MTREGDPQTREDMEKRLGELERADIADEIRKTEAGKTIQATLDSLKERKAGEAIPAPLLNSYFSPQNISPNTQQINKNRSKKKWRRGWALPPTVRLTLARLLPLRISITPHTHEYVNLKTTRSSGGADTYV